MSFPRPILVFGELPTRPPPWPRDIWEEEAEGREEQGRLPEGSSAPIPVWGGLGQLPTSPGQPYRLPEPSTMQWE